jgi:hypothetical protein
MDEHDLTDDVEHIAEFAAGTYWLRRAQDSDPIDGRGRLGGSTYVRSNAQYAGVVAGQIVIGHFVWVVFSRLLLIPFWIFTLYLTVILPTSVMANGPIDPLTNQQTWAVSPALGFFLIFCCFVFWAYVCAWRLSLKPVIKTVAKHGPSITYADGYRGPMGKDHTVYTGRR